jgi:ketosteroid isomerase-like protein
VTTQPAESTATLFERHIGNVMAHNVAGIMEDYNEESVILTPQGPVQGTAAIEALFRDFILPLLSPELIQKFNMVRQDVVGDAVYLLWSAEGTTPMAADTFVYRDGKIAYQSFAMAAWA